MARRIIDLSVSREAGIASGPPHMLPVIAYEHRQAGRAEARQGKNPEGARGTAAFAGGEA